jgi:hypothetical protein
VYQQKKENQHQVDCQEAHPNFVGGVYTVITLRLRRRSLPFEFGGLTMSEATGKKNLRED